MKAVIVDIDGTLSDATHRLHHITGGQKDWDAFFEAMVHDGCHEAIAYLVGQLYAMNAIVFCSGRPENYRDQTLAWLRDNLGFKAGHPRECPLYMRPADDRRPDYIVKRELLDQIRADGYEPWLVIDDRSSVVKMWRESGLTCLQCAEGDF